jgi:type IV pilus assembly protein PilO
MNAFQELQRVDWNNPGALSTAARAVLGVGILAIFAAIGWFMFIKPKVEERAGYEATEMTLRQDFESKQKQAANLEPLTEQLELMKAILDQMLKQLPNKTQLADLLVDVSQEALGAGIEVQLFKPQAESIKDFYAEKPILLRMVGNYHQFGKFVSGVATLPRVVILTMHDVALTPADKVAKKNVAPGTLVLEGTVKTYRYLDDDEMTSEAAPGTAPAPGSAQR